MQVDLHVMLAIDHAPNGRSTAAEIEERFGVSTVDHSRRVIKLPSNDKARQHLPANVVGRVRSLAVQRLSDLLLEPEAHARSSSLVPTECIVRSTNERYRAEL